MYNVKVSDIQKVKADFKKEHIDRTAFYQNVGNGQRADILYLIDGEVIQITSDGLMLFSNEFGYLDLENSLLAQYPCFNIPAKNSYSFGLIEEKDDVPPLVVEEIDEDFGMENYENNDYNDDYQGEDND
jgi:hypothetical protein